MEKQWQQGLGMEWTAEKRTGRVSKMSAKKSSRTRAAPRTVYKAKDGSRITDAEAAVIGRFCDKLVRKYGTLTAENFVEEAKGDHTVQGFLEWNNTKAADSWRRHQARVLMGSITVVIERQDREITVRGFQYVSSQGGYVPQARVFADKVMTSEVVEKAKREAVMWFHRFQNVRSVREVSPVFDAVERLIKKELRTETK